MAVKQQISISLENRPGMLAKACAALAKIKINIQAISVVDTADSCVVRLLVDKTVKARQALKKLGLTTTTTPVVVKQLPDEIGALVAAARKLSTGKINIEYVYGSAGGSGYS